MPGGRNAGLRLLLEPGDVDVVIALADSPGNDVGQDVSPVHGTTLASFNRS